MFLRKFTALLVLDLCGQFTARHSDLFSAFNILERESIGLYFVFSNDQHVTHTSFAGCLEGLFQPEYFIAQLGYKIATPKLAGEACRGTIHASAQWRDVNIGFADR